MKTWQTDTFKAGRRRAVRVTSGRTGSLVSTAILTRTMTMQQSVHKYSSLELFRHRTSPHVLEMAGLFSVFCLFTRDMFARVAQGQLTLALGLHNFDQI